MAGYFGADRAKGSAADLGYVCSVVAWPCPARSHGCCRLDRMLYTMRRLRKAKREYHDVALRCLSVFAMERRPNQTDRYALPWAAK